MSNLRAELKRQAKERQKAMERIRKVAPWIDGATASAKIDTVQERLKHDWDANVEKLKTALSDVASEELLKAEHYMMQGLVMISLKSLELTFGDLKTVQKNMNKFLQNFNRAIDEVDAAGIVTTYRQMQEKYGLNDLEFRDDICYDMKDIWNDDQKVGKLVWTVWEDMIKDVDDIGKEVKSFVSA